jgi:hypothetical protein
VLLCFRHSPEKNAHRFPGCLILPYDKAVSSVAFQKDSRIIHPRRFFCQNLSSLRALSGALGRLADSSYQLGRKLQPDTFFRKARLGSRCC